MKRPRQIITLCVALGALEVLRIMASVLYGFVLSSPIDQAFLSGPAVSIAFSTLLLIALIGVFMMRHWALILYIALQVLVVVLYLGFQSGMSFAAGFTVLLLGLFVAAVYPYRESFK